MPDSAPEWWRRPPALKPVVASSSNGLCGSVGFKPKKLRGFSGKGESWEVYNTHLEIVQRLNQWDDAAMLMHFCSELSDTALEFFSSLDIGTQSTYHRVRFAMAQRFGSMANQEATRHELENLRQKPDQTLQDLGQQVRRLAYNVYADDLPARREKEAIRSFMKAITSQEVVRALVNAPSNGSMTQAIEVAVRAQEMGKAFLSKPRAAVVRMVRPEESEDEVQEEDPESAAREEWAEDFKAYVARGYPGFRGGKGYSSAKKEDDKPARPCWLCQGEGHWSRECKYAPRNWPDWLKRDVELVSQGKAPLTTQVVGSPVVQASNAPTAQSLPAETQPAAQLVQNQGIQQPQVQTVRLVSAAQPQTLLVLADDQGQIQTAAPKANGGWKRKKSQAKQGKQLGAAQQASRDTAANTPSVGPAGPKGKAGGAKLQGNENGL